MDDPLYPSDSTAGSVACYFIFFTKMFLMLLYLVFKKNYSFINIEKSGAFYEKCLHIIYSHYIFTHVMVINYHPEWFKLQGQLRAPIQGVDTDKLTISPETYSKKCDIKPYLLLTRVGNKVLCTEIDRVQLLY